MEHGNKDLPLSEYPYMDNDLKSKGGGGDYVTTETFTVFESAVDERFRAFENSVNERFTDISNELSRAGLAYFYYTLNQLTDYLTNIDARINIETTVIELAYRNGMLWVKINLHFTDSIPADTVVNVFDINYQALSNYLQSQLPDEFQNLDIRPLGETGFAGLNAIGRIMRNSGTFSVRFFRDLDTTRNENLTATYPVSSV